jgi:flagellar L-ring protein precursor FlgH
MRPLLLLLVLAASASAQTAAPDSLVALQTVRRPISLFSDARAYQVGDLVTVVLVERTSASRASASQAQTDSRFGGAANAPAGLGGFFGLDAQFGQQSAADNRTVQSDLLTGTITARVVGVDPAGNLAIDGERRLNVDGATHLMNVKGLVRSADIRAGNTVLSHQIANADVVYRQEGSGQRFLRAGFLQKVGLAAVVIGAFVFSATQ